MNDRFSRRSHVWPPPGPTIKLSNFQGLAVAISGELHLSPFSGDFAEASEQDSG
jgi:hypothetical protein